VRGCRFLPRLNWILPSSGLLCGVHWLKTDVSGPVSSPETSVLNQITQRNNLEEKEFSFYFHLVTSTFNVCRHKCSLCISKNISNFLYWFFVSVMCLIYLKYLSTKVFTLTHNTLLYRSVSEFFNVCIYSTMYLPTRCTFYIHRFFSYQTKLSITACFIYVMHSKEKLFAQENFIICWKFNAFCSFTGDCGDNLKVPAFITDIGHKYIIVIYYEFH
jgi:hypothetical protein